MRPLLCAPLLALLLPACHREETGCADTSEGCGLEPVEPRLPAAWGGPLTHRSACGDLSIIGVTTGGDAALVVNYGPLLAQGPGTTVLDLATVGGVASLLGGQHLRAVACGDEGAAPAQIRRASRATAGTVTIDISPGHAATACATFDDVVFTAELPAGGPVETIDHLQLCGPLGD